MTTKKSSILTRLYTLSPEKVIRKLKGLFSPSEPSEAASPVTADFLRSREYKEIMSNHLPYDGSYDLHEAQNQTANFRYRHFDCKNRLGIFRWRGIERNLDFLLPILTDYQKRIIDFGGAASSVGFHSVVVDQLRTDAFGNPVPFHSLSEVEGEVDVIFSSHTLEHIPDLDGILGSIAAKLKPGGILILHLPTFSCERWRPGIHSNSKYNDHVWAFGLEHACPASGLAGYCNIAEKVAQFLKVQRAEYCGDDSLFLVAIRED